MAAGRSHSRWAAAGAAVAVCLGAGGVSWVGATISSGARAVFVPIEPCRLVDTRPGAPLAPAATTRYAVHGTNGECTIPAGATAISGNVTITDPTDDGFMTIGPAGGIGESSNLNWLRGQSPTPNAFTVALSPDGRIDVYNDRGAVDVIIDIAGYFEDHHHDDRYYTKSQVDTALGTKANAADVYSKAQIDASGANAVRAAGAVLSDGTIWPAATTIGEFTVVRQAVGVYQVTIPRARTGCDASRLPVVVAAPLDSNGQVRAYAGLTQCATGDVGVSIHTTTSTGTAVDMNFQFVAYAAPRAGLLVPTQAPAEGAPTVCVVQPDLTERCE